MGNPKVKNSKSLKDFFSSYCKHFLRMLYLLMMMIMMNYFYAIGDPRKAFSLISSSGYCKRPSLPRISDMPRAGFELAQNPGPGLVE